jgi:hypothetical protein
MKRRKVDECPCCCRRFSSRGGLAGHIRQRPECGNALIGEKSNKNTSTTTKTLSPGHHFPPHKFSNSIENNDDENTNKPLKSNLLSPSFGNEKTTPVILQLPALHHHSTSTNYNDINNEKRLQKHLDVMMNLLPHRMMILPLLKEMMTI